MSLKTPLGKVKGLGSAKHGVGHWLAQRMTAVALIPLSLWFVVQSLCFLTHDKPIQYYFNSPFEVIISGLFIAVALYHGRLGMQVVIEDYIHCHAKRLVLLWSVRFLTVVTVVAVLLAIIKLHFIGPA